MYSLIIGSIRFRIDGIDNLEIPDSLHDFRCENDAPSDVHIHVMDDFRPVPEDAVLRGEDVMLQYFSRGNDVYAAAKPGKFGPVTVAKYSSQNNDIRLFVNETGYPGSVRTLHKVLQLSPLREMMLRFDAWVLHASRIQVGSRAVLFTAPSGTGKSTQANLWHTFENAEVLCNDRTTLRKTDTGVWTYGFPVDGSSPVLKNEPLPLGAIVILRQGKENIISKLPALKAVRYLMEQTVADAWNDQAMLLLRDYWLAIVSDYPVYLFSCTPDRDAVSCLKERLTKDGVI